MSFKFRVGERVSIKTVPELIKIYGESYGHPSIIFGWDAPMENFCGRDATIAEVYEGNEYIGYRMEGSRYTWHEDALVSFFGVNYLTKGEIYI